MDVREAGRALRRLAEELSDHQIGEQAAPPVKKPNWGRVARANRNIVNTSKTISGGVSKQDSGMIRDGIQATLATMQVMSKEFGPEWVQVDRSLERAMDEIDKIASEEPGEVP